MKDSGTWNVSCSVGHIVRGREDVLPFFWGLALRTWGATQDEGVTGDDGCPWFGMEISRTSGGCRAYPHFTT